MSLVIPRKDQQAIVIGEDIYVTVHMDENNQVKLEIDAPSKMSVSREELLFREGGISREEINLLKNMRRK